MFQIHIKDIHIEHFLWYYPGMNDTGPSLELVNIGVRTVQQQAITLINVDQVLWRHTPPLEHNALNPSVTGHMVYTFLWMVDWKTVVNPLLMHWSYHIFTLSHW